MDELHPEGQCSCAHEGLCSYCQTYCLFCGADEKDAIHSGSICCKPFGEAFQVENPEGKVEAIYRVCTRVIEHDGKCSLDDAGPHGFMSIAESVSTAALLPTPPVVENTEG